MEQILSSKEELPYSIKSHKRISQKTILIFLIILIIISSLITFVILPYIKRQSTSRSILVPGSCGVLPEKYCSQGEIIEWTYQEQTFKIVGFHLSSGIPIFSPIKGQVGKTNADPPFHGSLASVKDITDINSPNFTLMGDVLFDNNLSIDVEKGGIIGYMQNTGIKNLGDYNFILRITKKDQNKQKFVTDEQYLFKLFPSLKK